MSESELLPCAHCGSLATLEPADYERSRYYVECNKCWIRTHKYLLPDYAIEAWNKRV
jgi:hypothetical protein